MILRMRHEKAYADACNQMEESFSEKFPKLNGGSLTPNLSSGFHLNMHFRFPEPVVLVFRASEALPWL